MKKSVLLLFSLCVSFYSCNEEDKVPNRTIFTFTPYYQNPAAEYWISIHDNSSGDLIDERPVMSDKLVFESTERIPNNKIDVTIFEGIPNSTTGNGSAEIYTGIDIGAEWVWPYKPSSGTGPDYGGSAGFYTLTITNVPSLYFLSVNDKFGNVTQNIPALSGGTITCNNVSIRGNGKKHLLSIDIGSGKQKYAMVSNPTDGQVVTIDYSSFSEYDRYLNLTFPGPRTFDSYVVGFEKGLPISYSGYKIQEYQAGSLKPALKSELNIGILNSLDKYLIQVDISPFFYESYGPAPTSIQYIPPSTYQASGSTIDDYKITSSAPFTFREAVFGYTEGSRRIRFGYVAESGYSGQHHDAISSTLAGKYGIDLSKLKYGGSEISIGRSYDDVLKYYFNPTFDIFTPYTETRVNIYAQ